MSNSEWVKLLTENVTIKVVKNFVKIGIASHFLLLLICASILYLLLNENTYRDTEYKFRAETKEKLFEDSLKIEYQTTLKLNILAQVTNLNIDNDVMKKDIYEIKGRLRMFHE